MINRLRILVMLLGATFCAVAAATPEEVEVDVRLLEPGMLVAIQTDWAPVWIVRRSPEGRKRLNSKAVPIAADPESVRNAYRSIKPEYLVIYGVCPKSGYSPTYTRDSGFSCPGGATYDLSGRSVSGGDWMPIPKHRYRGEFTLVVSKRAPEGKT